MWMVVQASSHSGLASITALMKFLLVCTYKNCHTEIYSNFSAFLTFRWLLISVPWVTYIHLATVVSLTAPLFTDSETGTTLKSGTKWTLCYVTIELLHTGDNESCKWHCKIINTISYRTSCRNGIWCDPISLASHITHTNLRMITKATLCCMF
jgi:hypothetical protein